MNATMISGIIILIFAITGMTMLLNIDPFHLENKKRNLYFCVMILVVVMSIPLMLKIGKPFRVLYPLLVHLPLLIIFCILTSRGWAKVFFVLLTMIFLSYPPVLFYVLTKKYLQINPVLELVVLIITYIFVLFCIRRYMQIDFNYVMEHLTTKETLRFCLVPIGYNVLVYSFGKYDFSTTDHPTRVVLFLSVLGVYALLLGFFRHTREMEEVQRERDVLYLQMQGASKQLLTLQSSSEQAKLYRHDMRHQFALLGVFLSNQDFQGALAYLHQMQEDIDMITPVCYCRNNTVNLVLSYFVEQGNKQGVKIFPEISLPETFDFSETELCALLSNGLENAIYAVSQLEDVQKRMVQMTIKQSKDNLLIMMQNAYNGSVEMKNQIPVSNREGHGFGCRSMVTIAEKQGGFCVFKAEKGIFTLRVVLPLGESKLQYAG